MVVRNNLDRQKVDKNIFFNEIKSEISAAVKSENADLSGLEGTLTEKFAGSLSKENVGKILRSISDVFSWKKIPEALINFINFLGRLLGIDDIYSKLENTKYIFGYKLKESHLSIIGNKMKQKFPETPLNAGMIQKACENRTLLPVEYLLAFMQNDSGLGTAGKGKRTKNPGNVGNDDAGNLRAFSTRQEGVDACAGELQKRIDKYFKLSADNKGVGFNAFPTPQELATGKSKGGKKFYGIYMSDPKGPSRVASIVKTRNKDLLC